jgi:tetratricopeptide (TPR) repeat protein
MTRDSSSDTLTKLHRLLVDHFDLDELRTLCFDLNVDYDTLRGEEKSGRSRELITIMLRQNRLAELIATLQSLRPRVAWPNIETLSPEERLTWTTATEMTSATDYLVALRDYCANLPYLTLHDIRPPKTLDEVYVPLKARPLPCKDEKPERDEERAMGELERGGPLSIAEVMRQREPPHVLILGEPGTGKSTLLRQLAEHAWDAPGKIGLDRPHLPILVPLRRLAAAEGVLEERLNRALAAELTLAQALPQGFFTHWSKQTGANWLILLDALDEVSTTEQRPQLMQWLKGLLGRIGQNRVVLTSRPSGYAQGELDDKLFGHYDLLSFTPDQTGEFARRWFGNGKSTGTPGQFLKELERVRAGALSGTPLLLTIAAKVFLEKGTLPERRSGLYEEFVDIWLSEAGQHGLRAELGNPVCDVAKFALARLALAMTEQPAQTEASLSKVAVQYLRDAVPLTPERAEIASKKFLKVMARRSGVFTRRGDVYDFIHPTFREYLAAWAVVRESRHDDGYDMEQVWQRAVSRWEDKNWREVALFALCVLSDCGQDVAALVGMWQEEAGAYFSGAALAEHVKVDESFSDCIIDELATRARSMKFNEALIVITLLDELRSYKHAGDQLLALASDEEMDKEMRVYAAESLGGLGRVNEAAPILVTLARDEELSKSVRELAAEALGELGRVDEATSILLVLVRDRGEDEERYELVCWRAVQAMRNLGRANDLVALTCDESEKLSADVRRHVAEALGKLGCADEAVQVWLTLARDEKVSVDVRWHAAEALSELGRANEAAQAWLALARDAHDEVANILAGWRAIAALSELGRVDDLLMLTYDEKVNSSVRADAAKALSKLDEGLLLFEGLIRLFRFSVDEQGTQVPDADSRTGCPDEPNTTMTTPE